MKRMKLPFLCAVALGALIGLFNVSNGSKTVVQAQDAGKPERAQPYLLGNHVVDVAVVERGTFSLTLEARRNNSVACA